MIFSAIFFLISLLTISISLSLGVVLQVLLENLFQGLIRFNLPNVRLMAALPAVMIGMLLLFGLALLPITSSTSPPSTTTDYPVTTLSPVPILLSRIVLSKRKIVVGICLYSNFSGGAKGITATSTDSSAE